MTKTNIARDGFLVVFLIVSIVAVTLLVRAYVHALIMPINDQNFFLPIVTSVREGVLEHPLFRLPGADTNLFNWHGWLTPYLYNLFLFNDRYEFTLMSGIPWIFISVGLAGFAIWNETNRLFFVILMTAYAGICFFHLGRPELVAQPFILAIAYVLTSNVSIFLKSISIGALSAIIALISPMLSIMACTATMIYFRLSAEFSLKFWLGILCAALGFIATIVVCFGANEDITIFSWIHGLLTWGDRIMQRQNIHHFFDFYVAHRYLPLLILPLIVVFLVFSEHCIARRDWLIVVLTVFLSAMIVWTSVKNPLAHYNFAGILPLLMFVMMKFPSRSARASNFYGAMLGLFALANSGSLVLRSLEYSAVKETGVAGGYREFLRAIPRDATVAAYMPYAVVAKEVGLSSRGYFEMSSVTSAALDGPDYIIFPPESFKGISLPEGYCFFLKQGQDVPIRVFGFKIASYSRGWDFFALTRCMQTQNSQGQD